MSSQAQWSSGLQLKEVQGPELGRIRVLTEKAYQIGRSATPGAEAPGWLYSVDDGVSRLHAELEWDEQTLAFVVKHRSKTNDTYVNRKPIAEAHLIPGDTIELGRCSWLLQRVEMANAEARSSDKMFDQVLDRMQDREDTPDPGGGSGKLPRRLSL